MTIEFDNQRRLEFIGNGSDVNFPYDFKIFEETDLNVFVDAVLQFVNVNYTVTGVGDQGGGNVVFVTAPADLTDIIVDSDVPATQTIDFEVGGKFKPSTINFVNDKLTVIDQQTKTLIESRGVLYPETDFLDQNGKDNILPVMQAQTTTEIPIWSKDLNNNIIATVLEEAGNLSNLRAELASETEVSPGAGLVGYFDSQDGLGKTVDEKLKQIQVESIIGKNVIIASDFQMNLKQRGTTFTALTFSDIYFADRFQTASISAGSGSNVDVDFPDGNIPIALFNRASQDVCRLTVNTATSPAAAESDCVLTVIEGYDFLPLFGKPTVIQICVRSSIIGKYHIVLINRDADQSIGIPFTINVANTWELKQLNVPANPTTGGWNLGNNVGLEFNIILSAGSDLFGTSGVWQTNPLFPILDSDQVEFTSNPGATFEFNFLKFETGTVPTPWEVENIADVTQEQERYYQKSYNVAEAPGTVGAISTPVRFDSDQISPVFTDTITYRVRLHPTAVFPVTIYNPVTGTAGSVRNTTLATDVAVVGSVSSSETGFNFEIAAGVAVGEEVTYHWAVNADF